MASQRDVGTDLYPFEGPQEHESELALVAMLDSLNREAHLTPTGQFLCVQKIRNALRNRLKLKMIVNREPKFLEQEIVQPVFILGFPRSGTTFLHRTLVETGRFQSLTLYDCLHPTHSSSAKRTCERKPIALIFNFILRLLGLRKVHREQDLFDTYAFLLQFVAKRLRAIHDCRLDQPEEESIVLDMCFSSQLTEAMFHVPTYSHYIENQSPLHMYYFLKQILQVRQAFSSKGLPWILKSPNHLEWMNELVQVFPDARFLHPRRLLSTCLLSTISASCHARRMCSDHVDIREVGHHWLKKFRHLIHKVTYEKRKFSFPIWEVDYEDLSHQVEILTNIFDFLNMPGVLDFPSLTSQKFHRTSQHIYEEGDLGLSEKTFPSLGLPFRFSLL
jgi:hypothetical protein